MSVNHTNHGGEAGSYMDISTSRLDFRRRGNIEEISPGTIDPEAGLAFGRVTSLGAKDRVAGKAITMVTSTWRSRDRESLSA